MPTVLFGYLKNDIDDNAFFRKFWDQLLFDIDMKC